jgi:hypothetical protein
MDRIQSDEEGPGREKVKGKGEGCVFQAGTCRTKYTSVPIQDVFRKRSEGRVGGVR